MTKKKTDPSEHPFIEAPNRTIFTLAIPVLFALIAEPITGMVDTAFVKELGTVPLAALGVGTILLSSFFWIFNFLSISAQTEIAQALGKNDRDRAQLVLSLAMILAILFSFIIMIVISPLAGWLAGLLGAEGAVRTDAISYVQARLWGAPAVLITLVGFGAMRGMQDMRTPLWIAILINAMNILLDYPMIFGFGVIPAWGVAGAAYASAISQWIGAGFVLWLLHRNLGFIPTVQMSDVKNLLQVGGDLFIRTSLLMLFLMVATRVANQISPEAGAAHQAIRTVWFFAALLMEAFAMTAQSLVGYFLGADQMKIARRAATLAARWSFVCGLLVMLLMLLSVDIAATFLIPTEAYSIFVCGWIAAAMTQPVSAFAFVTDGIHWGTADYKYLRNAMLIATLTSICGLFLIDVQTNASMAFAFVWGMTWVWLAIRGVLGMIRIWPGVGTSPLKA